MKFISDNFLNITWMVIHHPAPPRRGGMKITPRIKACPAPTPQKVNPRGGASLRNGIKNKGKPIFYRPYLLQKKEKTWEIEERCVGKRLSVFFDDFSNGAIYKGNPYGASTICRVLRLEDVFLFTFTVAPRVGCRD